MFSSCDGERAGLAVERFRRASESLAVTRAFALPAASDLAKSTTARVKAACFQLLTKASNANSFVLDTPRWFVSDAINPPIEGRIPDAI
jgi:hypothetical protein